MYVSASNFACVIRLMSTNKYLLTIKPELSFSVKYRIYRVMLSPRGYLIIQARSLFKTFNKDMLLIYTINGEEVAKLELDECVNDMVLDKHGYYLVYYLCI